MPHLHLYAINCLKMSENSIRNVHKILLGRNVTTSEVCNSSSDQVFAWTDLFLLLVYLFLVLHRSDLQYILHNLDKMLITSDIKHILFVFNIKQFDLFFSSYFPVMDADKLCELKFIFKNVSFEHISSNNSYY